MSKVPQPDAVESFEGLVVKAENTMDYFTIVKRDATDNKLCLNAGATDTPMGICGKAPEFRTGDGAGGRVKKTKWAAGDRPVIFTAGTVPVLVGEDVVKGQKCVPGTGGKGYAQDSPTFTDWALEATPANTAINAAANKTIDEVQASRASDAQVIGEFVEDIKSGKVGYLRIGKIA
jgi:hypothetical protein